MSRTWPLLHDTRRLASLAALATLGLGCASGPDPRAADDAPGPMRPLAPDHALDAAPPLDVLDEAATRAWIAERVAQAQAGVRERVRLPLVRRGPFGCDCPPFGIGPTASNGPFYWLAIVDLTSAGIPRVGDDGWVGWVDGRFTGATDTYRSSDDGGSDVVMPVFEVLRQRRRGADEPAHARFVRE